MIYIDYYVNKGQGKNWVSDQGSLDVLVLDFFDHTLKSVEDVERYLKHARFGFYPSSIDGYHLAIPLVKPETRG
jgi:hypothetical protein